MADGATIPPTVLERFAASATSIAANNLRLTSAVLELCDSLERAGVPVIAYKGPSLAVRAYGNVALRHYNDLDVLVRRQDMSHATSVLQGLGYGLHDPVGGAALRATMKWGHHYSFFREPDTLVEVHWQFHKPLFGSPLPETAVWRSAVSIEIGDRSVRTLDPRHELLVLATHGSWHGWSQLSWVCDFAELIARDEELDHEELLQMAGRFGCSRPLLLAFRLSAVLLGGELRSAVARAVQGDVAVDAAARLVARRMFSDGMPGLAAARLQLALRHRLGDKLTFALRAAFLPNPADVRALPLPAALFPLYYVMRPFRIALKYRPRKVPVVP